MPVSPRKHATPGAFGAWILGASLLVLPTGCTWTSDPGTSAMSFASEPLVGKIVWNDLITEDLDSAHRFYAGLFGWTFEQTKGPEGRPYWLARSGRIYVAGMVAVPPPPSGSEDFSRWLPYMSVKSVDASVVTATTAGARIAAAARNVSLGRVAAIVDPEGAVIGLARSRIGDPDDATTAPAAGRVVWTELLANDPSSAAQFYATVIGYVPRTIVRRGGHYTLLTVEGADRAGILQNPSNTAAPAWLTYFGVSDPAAAADRVEALGGKVVLRPSEQLREGTMAVVTDPSGALFALRKVNP